MLWTIWYIQCIGWKCNSLHCIWHPLVMHPLITIWIVSLDKCRHHSHKKRNFILFFLHFRPSYHGYSGTDLFVTLPKFESSKVRMAKINFNINIKLLQALICSPYVIWKIYRNYKYIIACWTVCQKVYKSDSTLSPNYVMALCVCNTIPLMWVSGIF